MLVGVVIGKNEACERFFNIFLHTASKPLFSFGKKQSKIHVWILSYIRKIKQDLSSKEDCTSKKQI